MPMATERQKTAREHNWQLYKLAGIRSALSNIQKTPSLTDESRGILYDLIDQVDLLTSSMKLRK